MKASATADAFLPMCRGRTRTCWASRGEQAKKEAHPVTYKMVLRRGMSLKAKLEAVIYAAEEPVTLAQLAGLFAEEALELKAEREAAAAAQGG